ncbi:hypothetical protein KXD93_21380 [Mucilaginibacter sp. BJC16-A38]|uniref:hypothetical protein n=1 Tax=Mucilaginibacter phenanthrenivorans TaxID=1234842 RepID=UPI002156FE98|nr:hypothetical protein [Mucilaginibacter phenanthrenivorans]MCR8560218.1 hypothetical protein [Mucilaginibacter phenanthrenivorans]
MNYIQKTRRVLLSNKGFALLIVLTIVCLQAYSQQTHYDLAKMFKEKQLIIYPGKKTVLINDAGKSGISTDGIIWLKDVDFSTGTIELDMRGRNEFLKSFLGIAFHATDTLNYESVYFRPFNFQYTPDTARRKWSVQYMSIPDYSYERLRKEQTGKFENDIKPNPKPEDWFHARIVVTKDSTIVYVNHGDKPSLSVKNLSKRINGLIGLWTSTGARMSDFANLFIKQD